MEEALIAGLRAFLQEKNLHETLLALDRETGPNAEYKGPIPSLPDLVNVWLQGQRKEDRDASKVATLLDSMTLTCSGQTLELPKRMTRNHANHSTNILSVVLHSLPRRTFDTATAEYVFVPLHVYQYHVDDTSIATLRYLALSLPMPPRMSLCAKSPLLDRDLTLPCSSRIWRLANQKRSCSRTRALCCMPRSTPSSLNSCSLRPWMVQ